MSADVKEFQEFNDQLDRLTEADPDLVRQMELNQMMDDMLKDRAELLRLVNQNGGSMILDHEVL